MMRLVVMMMVKRKFGGRCRSPCAVLRFASLVGEQGGVGADRLREDLIELAGDDQLVLLKLGEARDHERIFEVRRDHRL